MPYQTLQVILKVVLKVILMKISKYGSQISLNSMISNLYAILDSS